MSPKQDEHSKLAHDKKRKKKKNILALAKDYQSQRIAYEGGMQFWSVLHSPNIRPRT